MAQDEHTKARSNSIARRMIQLETTSPGLIKMSHNSRLKPIMLKRLLQLGYKKPLFTSYHDFVFQTAFGDHQVLALIIPYCLFIGSDHGSPAMKNCWDGTGTYRGYQGILALFDFSHEDKDNVLMVIDTQPFFNELSDLLDAVEDLSRG